MAGETVEAEIATCPNCGAIAPARTAVCRSCGVNLLSDGRARERLARLKQGLDVIDASTAAPGLAEPSRVWAIDWRQLLGQLRFVALGAGALAVLIVLWAGWRADLAAQRANEDARQAANARDCLQRADYLCARDGFLAVLRDDPTYPGAAAALTDARLGLAEQDAEAGIFAAAIAEVDVVLAVDPGNRTALFAASSYYNRWHQYALARGDWLTALRVYQEWQARFPGMPAGQSVLQ
jgi:tetratricopeptide (TPR) repeat protein